jgi:hypothetical protein
MEALKRLNCSAIGIGRNELAIPLIDALGEFALNNPSPRVVCANLLKKDENFPGMVASWELADRPGAPRTAFVAVVGPSVAKTVKNDPAIAFGPVDQTLKTVLTELEQHQVALRVLLYEGTAKEAMACAKEFPQFQIVVCQTREEEPPAKPDQVGQSLVIQLGHKGRYVGVVGVFPGARQGALHYELVSLDPEYETPAGQEALNPILPLFEKYSQEVKDRNYLGHFAKTQHPIQLDPAYKTATYVGSAKCKRCHEESFKVWANSPHSHAYASLEKAKRPGLRQYDGECVLCHVTGFAYDGGFTDEKQTTHLRDNGCENCHGPGSLHIKNNHDEKLNALMNPYKTKPNETPDQQTARLNRLDASCQKCHDLDNDSHWKLDKWTTGHIAHTEPKE